MRKKYSKLLSFILVVLLFAQTASMAFAETAGLQSGESGVKTTLNDFPNKVYAGVEYRIEAETAGGEDSENKPYVWEIKTEDGSSILNEVNFQPMAKGYNSDNALWQVATFCIPFDYVGKNVSVCAAYAKDLKSTATVTFKVRKPVTKVESITEVDNCAYSHYEDKTKTLYIDESTIIGNEERCFASLNIQYDDSEDSLTLAKGNGVNGTFGNISKNLIINDVVLTKNAPTTGETLLLNPASGYKTTETINLVKGVPIVDLELRANGGYFTDNIVVAKSGLMKNNAYGTDNDLYGTIYIPEDKKCMSSGLVMQTGETVNISATFKNRNGTKETNDTIEYTLCDDEGNPVEPIKTNDENGCLLQVKNPGSYVVKYKTVSVNNGCLDRVITGSFNVIAKVANPINNFEIIKDSVVLSNKEFTNRENVTYKTSGNIKDYIKFKPVDYFDDLSFSSDNTNLIKIDSSGNFEVPLSATGGTTKIWVKSNIAQLQASVDVTVIPGTVSMKINTPDYVRLPAGHSEKLNLIVNPSNSEEEVFWTSSNPEILKVDEKGYITSAENFKGEPVSVSVQATSSSGVVATTQIIVCESIPTTSSTISVESLNSDKLFKVSDYEYDFYCHDEIKITYDIKGVNGEKPNDIIKWELAPTEVGDFEDYFDVKETGENSITLKSKTAEPVTVTAYALKAGKNLSEATDTKSVVLNTKVPAKSLTIKPSGNPSFIVGTDYELTLSMPSSHKSLPTTDEVAFEVEDPAVVEIVQDEENPLKYAIKGLKVGTTKVVCYACYDADNAKDTASAMSAFVVTVNEKIKLDAEKAKVADIRSSVYTGKEATPTVTVTYDGKKLKAGTDYVVSYKNNINVGKATAEIRGVGNYTGTLVKEFDITKATYKGVKAEGYSGVYDGKAHSITLTGLPEGAKVSYTTVKNGEYDATCPVFENAGSYTTYYKVESPNYNDVTGYAKVAISALQMTNINMSLEYQKVTYNGKAMAPKVIIVDPFGKTLVENTDFTAKYNGKRVDVGRYSVDVTLKGNYKGKASQMFTITPKAPNKVNARLYKGYDDVKFSWSKVKNASGYYVYYKKPTDEKYTYFKRTTKTSVSATNLSDGVKYTFKVVPYVKADDKKLYTSPSYKTDTVYTLKKIVAPNVTKRSKTSVKVRWDNIDGETGYQISKSTKKGTTNVVKTVKSTKATYSTVKATKGKTLYYKVRAYKVVDGKRIYAPWSKVQAFKVK